MLTGLAGPQFTVKDRLGATVETVTIAQSRIRQRGGGSLDTLNKWRPYYQPCLNIDDRTHQGYFFHGSITVFDKSHKSYLAYAYDQLFPDTESAVHACVRLISLYENGYTILFRPHVDAAAYFDDIDAMLSYAEFSDRTSADRRIDQIAMEIKSRKPIEKLWLDYDLSPPDIIGDFNDDFNNDFANQGS